MIEFSIGPNGREMHDRVYNYLLINGYDIQHISYKGDHYSEIHVYGDYNRFAKDWQNEKGISYEHWS